MEILDKKAVGQQKEISLGAGEANLYSLIFLVPVLLLFGLPFVYLWPQSYAFENLEDVVQGYQLWQSLNPLKMILILLGGIVLHEGIHGISWALFCKRGHRSIRYGIVWQYLSPYCHCMEPLKLGHYLIGALMPGILLGLLPSLIALFTGHLLVLLFGLFFTLAAGGDLLIVWMLRREDSNSLVQDHPDKIGCIVFYG